MFSRRYKIRRFLFLIGLWTLLTMLLSYLSSQKQTPVKRTETRSAAAFLVDTPQCQIPNIDLFHHSLPEDVKNKGKNIRCTGKAFTYADGTMLRINRTLMDEEMKDSFAFCRYHAIEKDPDSYSPFTYKSSREKFRRDIEIRDEFIKVSCWNHKGFTFYVGFHVFVLPKHNVEVPCHTRLNRHVETARPKEIVSVEMVGMDSVSRLSMMRHMPRTRRFLLDELGAVEMLGYNKVADNTQTNIVPLLSGQFLHELDRDQSQTFDHLPFIWKDFSAAGYRTLFAEDDPATNIFSRSKEEGFEFSPADYYFRPLALAMERTTHVWSTGHHCVVNKMETEIVLNYLTEFSRLFHGKPHFGFTFITRLSHAVGDFPEAADKTYLSFLQKLKEDRRLDNTILIYFSDHGVSTGAVQTFIGKLEERLPFFFIVLPNWFESHYPKLFSNLRMNSNRLTTPFDVYETLKDILFFDGNERKASLTKRGISLFREIPETRSCKHAGIVPLWCTCMKRQNMSTSSEIVQAAARKIVRSINSLLKGSLALCERLTLKLIRKAEQLVPHGYDYFNNHNITIYQVSIETDPGNAAFKGTLHLQRDTDNLILVGEITRTDIYRTQSECIDDNRLTSFCYCKTR